MLNDNASMHERVARPQSVAESLNNAFAGAIVVLLCIGVAAFIFSNSEGLLLASAGVVLVVGVACMIAAEVQAQRAGR